MLVVKGFNEYFDDCRETYVRKCLGVKSHISLEFHKK